MIALSRWCIVHYRRVVAGWLVLAVALTVLASAAGRQYTSNFSLPGTQSQRVIDLLHAHFPAQAGDVDQIVFHSAPTSIDAAPVRRAIEPLLAKVRRMPHVETVLSPYSAAGRQAVSRDGHTAFATVTYDKRANLLPDATGKPVLRAVAQVTRPGLSVAAGGQVMEQAEGFSVGPATGVGVIAAFVILLLTFGSLIAAGLPLLTAGLGLVSGVGLIGLATHVTDMSNVAPELALMIGLGVGIDYALFIVTRFRESFARLGDVHASVLEAMDTSGRAILLAGSTVIIALLGMFATGVAFMYGLSIASILAVLLTLGASLTVLPALLGYGAALGAMNLCFYMALRTIPLGVAVAVEFLGPLAVATASSRRRIDIIWIGLALAGIVLLTPSVHGPRALDPVGVGYAFCAGVLWGFYIVFGQRAGAVLGARTAAFGTVIAAVVVLPVGIAHAGAALLAPKILLGALAVGLFSSALPYSLEMVALTRMKATLYGTLTSLEPAVGALMGLMILGERLSLVQWSGIGVVVVAALGAALSVRGPVVSPE